MHGKIFSFSFEQDDHQYTIGIISPIKNYGKLSTNFGAKLWAVIHIIKECCPIIHLFPAPPLTISLQD